MLSAGTRLGQYEITAMLGAGGMGEVYRARDLKLGREVAIKVLPEAFARDPERIARFQREAKVLASLNHPNIAALYGMEESESRHFLIMELVEGQTLSERLKAHGSGLRLEETLSVARQMAEAIEAAHEKGVVHRDLKPANVKVTPDEKVKVLDFGLAKAMEPPGAAPSPDAQLTNSPTLSQMATQVGMILGTAAYMSPEQAQGLQADHRSDVFSFGSVLYELLTGRQPFQGENVAAILASVLIRDPDLAALPPNLNPRLTELLKRCLEKNPKRRYQAAGDLRAEVEAIGAAPRAVPQSAMAAATRESLWRRLVFVGVPALALGAAIATVATWLATRPAAPKVSRLTMATLGVAAYSANANERNIAITRDGRRVVYVGNNQTQIFVRSLDALEPTVITTDGSSIRGIFLSPDDLWVGYFAANGTMLKKVAITGGPPILVSTTDGLSRGATWTPADSIVLATNNPTTGLQRVSAAGGATSETLTRPEGAGTDHLWPEALPGGNAVLFTIGGAGGLDSAQVAVLDFRSNTQKILVQGGSHARYVTSGHLVYVAAGMLRAIPFDLDRLETRGSAVPVVPQVATVIQGGGEFATADDGTLVYVPVGGIAANRTLVWVDRTGKEEATGAPPRAYQYPRLSPDGSRIALDVRDRENDIWVWDTIRRNLGRLTFESGTDQSPLWTADSKQIIFSSQRGGALGLWLQAADGSGMAQRLTTSSNLQIATSITADGTLLVYYEVTPATSRDIWILPLNGRALTSGGSSAAKLALQTRFDEQNGVLSPDGRWLAYQSNNSGQFEIYIRPFPILDGQWLVSTGGGRQPVWARNGRELFYVAADGSLMHVGVDATAAAWRAGTPSKLFDGQYYYSGVVNGQSAYDVSADGRRFLMIKTDAGTNTGPPSVIVVQHFDEELKRLAPPAQ